MSTPAPTPEGSPERSLLEQALGGVGYGLYVASATDGTNVAAFAANWLTQISFTPPLMAFAVTAGTTRATMIADSGVFAINVMDVAQEELVTRFYLPIKETLNDLAGAPFSLGDTGCPILDDALSYFECRVIQRLEPGDHVLYIGEAVNAGVHRSGTPLTLRDTGLLFDH